MTAQDIYQSAQRHHKDGRLREARELYQRILAQQPDHADALHMLGVAAHQEGNLSEAERWIRGAIAANSQRADYHGNLGVVLASVGRGDEAIAAYRHAIAVHPEYAEAHNNLGIALAGQGKLDEAIAEYQTAIRIRPTYIEPYNNMGTAHSAAGRYRDAIRAFEAALTLRGDFAEAHYNLGNALLEEDRPEQAAEAYRKAISIQPQSAQAFFGLGNALKQLQKFIDAIDAYRQALNLRPEYVDVHNNMAMAFKSLGRRDEAIAAFEAALKINPQFPEALYNLGIIFQGMGRYSEAIAVYRRSLAARPGFRQALHNLGNALREDGQMDESIEVYRQALQLYPDYQEVHNDLAISLKETGRLPEALTHLEPLIRSAPDDVMCHSNFMMMLHYSSEHDGPAILEQMTRWDERHAAPLREAIAPHLNDRTPTRRLNIGYVSGDFNEHVVGRNMIPLFREHDREAFKIYCYMNSPRIDAYTDEFRRYAHVWREIVGIDDDSAARLVRDDRIDILVDLSGHTARNRLMLFARKPAPVQVTFGGYPGGTGLKTMDYHISDPHLDPSEFQSHYVEKIVRVPDSFWCYDPAAMQLTDGPAVTPLPALSNGFVTFGSLNNLGKIGTQTLKLWSRVLDRVPKSRMIMLIAPGSARRRATEDLGIDPSRIDFIPRLSRSEYMKSFQRIDLGLDSLPYNAHTTGLDSFWMGVPLVTRVGRTAAGRAGMSHLTNLRLTELIAHTDEEFVNIAVDLANDLCRLGDLRSTLRQRMLDSPLTNAKLFARSIEQVYRQIWRDYCESTG